MPENTSTNTNNYAGASILFGVVAIAAYLIFGHGHGLIVGAIGAALAVISMTRDGGLKAWIGFTLSGAAVMFAVAGLLT